MNEEQIKKLAKYLVETKEELSDISQISKNIDPVCGIYRKGVINGKLDAIWDICMTFGCVNEVWAAAGLKESED